MTYVFSRVSVLGFLLMNQYSSSSSKISKLVSELIHRVSGFFYPIQHIGFAHIKDFSDTASTYSRIVNSHRILPYFLRILYCLGIRRVFVIAVFAKTSLSPRPIKTRIDLILCLPALRATTLFVSSYLFHAIIIYQKTLLVHS